MTCFRLIRAMSIAAVLTCLPALAQEKVAIIDIQNAITRTEEGQKLVEQLQMKYEPRSKEIEGLQQEIADLRSQLNRGANTMSESARRELSRQIEVKERSMQRTVEDARGEFGREQQEIFNEVGGKLMTVIDRYAKEKGYSIVLDISSPQSPVLYAVNEVNITDEIIKAYDQDGGGAAPGAAAAPDAKPAQQQP